MNTNKTILIVAVIIVAALAVVIGVHYLNDDNGDENIASAEFKATFEEYDNPDHSTTTVKYVLNGKEITGTVSMKNNTKVVVTLTSTEKLYGMAVNTLPHRDNSLDNDEYVTDLTADDNGLYTYTLNATIKQVFEDEDVTVSVTPYFNMIGDWPSAVTHTKIILGEGLTCTYLGKAVNNGDVLDVSGSQDMHLIVDYPETKTLIWSGEWDNGGTAFGGIEKAKFPYDISIPLSATFSDATGTLEISVR